MACQLCQSEPHHAACPHGTAFPTATSDWIDRAAAISGVMLTAEQRATWIEAMRVMHRWAYRQGVERTLAEIHDRYVVGEAVDTPETRLYDALTAWAQYEP